MLLIPIMEEDKLENNQNLHECKECGLHYKNKDTAEKCEAWCKKNHTCNVEITKEAEENKLGQLERKCEEYLNNWKRSAADFINYKKEELERIGTVIKYANQELILKILPILDNIELAEKQLPEKLKNGEEGSAQSIEWTKGFLQIQKQAEEFLKREGIEEIKTVGGKVDPKTMGMVEEGSGGQTSAGSGTGMEEVQRGYTIQEKVLRPAKVRVTK